MTIYSQTIIDYIVVTKFPENPEFFEQIDNNTIATGHYYNNDKVSFVFIRAITTDENGKEIIIYRSSLKNLNQTKRINLFIDKLRKNTFVF